MKVKSESEVAQLCPTLSDPMDCSPPGSSVHGVLPGKSTGVGCHRLFKMSVISKINDKIPVESFCSSMQVNEWPQSCDVYILCMHAKLFQSCPTLCDSYGL